MYRYVKDPDAELDYGLDWAPWLGADAIASSVWEVSGPDSALVAANGSYDAGATVVWLSGGTAGATYRVTNRVTTAGGRTDDRSFQVAVRQR